MRSEPLTAAPGRAEFTRSLDDDAAALAGFVAGHEDVLTRLPVKADRDDDQRRQATAALAAVRAARRDFLLRHADAVYDRLTDGRTRRVRLPELVTAAAERFPGLLPDQARLAAEAGRVQADKDGYEIDQGIFCGALLRSPTAGRHLIDTMLMPTPRAQELLAEFQATDRVRLDVVLLERDGPAAHLTFHNSDCLNAEDNRLIADMETAVDLALLDDRVRVGVLRGGPVQNAKYRGRRVFSAGINLKELHAGRISFVGFLLGRELGYLHKLLRGTLVVPEAGAWSDRTVQKPWIGVVDTFAIGGGMQLLLTLDQVIAEDQAYLSLPAAEEGIVPGLGNLRLTRLLGGRLARQVILGGRRIAATDPEAGLMYDEVVPAADLDQAVERAIEQLSAPAVAANRRMINLAEEPIDQYREYLAEFAVAQAERMNGDDVLAKVERRWKAASAPAAPRRSA